MLSTQEISKRLKSFSIEEIALESKFYVHADNELSPISFIVGFFLMISNSQNTLSSWAIAVSEITKRVFSISAITAKLQYRQVKFAKMLLKSVLSEKYASFNDSQLKSKLLSYFPRVRVEDSSCIHLPSNLAAAFPGAHSNKGEAATARIQCRMELHTNTIEHLAVQCFRDNDQKFAWHILQTLQAGDLILRDLGYGVLWVFGVIIQSSAFFLSRHRFDVKIYEVDTVTPIDLSVIFQKAIREGVNSFELSVLMGQKALLPVRFVAIRVPQSIANERRRKAKADRSQSANHSKAYMDALDWTLFVTNVPIHVWTHRQMLQVYGLRWRIEIVFKAWKSQFHFEHLFDKERLSPPRAEITLYLLLVWITLFFVKAFNFFLDAVYTRTQKFVSLLKFAKFFKEHFVQLMQNLDIDFYIDLIAKHCTYQKRRNITNFCEMFYLEEGETPCNFTILNIS
jgi:hypothetical protein